MHKIYKMKYLLSLFFFLNFAKAFSQDYINLIAKETCECFNGKKINLRKASTSELQAQLGACMLPNYVKYKDKMAKEDVAEFTDHAGMRKLGEKIGVK